MNEAIAAAQADTQFQFLLAKLFGQKRTVVREQKTLLGWAWRGRFFVTQITEVATEAPKPSQDSQ